MLRRGVEAEILPFALARGIGVINYSPMLSGLLTGKMTVERVAALPVDDWRRKNIEFGEPRLSRNLQLVEMLRQIGEVHGVTPGVVAVAWTLHNPAVTAAIVGGRSAQQVEETAAALTFQQAKMNTGTSSTSWRPRRPDASVFATRSANDPITQTKTPAEAGVFLRSWRRNPNYIAGYKVGNHACSVLLQQLCVRAAIPVH